MIVVGVDENGLGPRLGPLLVTAVSARAEQDGMRIASSPASGAGAARLGDSKKLVSYTNSTLGEAWARALRPNAKSPDALIRAMSLDPHATLTRACPPDHIDQCWQAPEEFAATGDAVDAVASDLRDLARRGLHVLRAQIVVVCTRALNDAAAAGTSRFDVDLHSMERLVLAARAHAGEDVTALCGKVGGLVRYPPHFGPLSEYLHTTLTEERARSEYRIPGVGHVAFLRDADESSALVGLASLIGKWARDLLMARVVRYHQARNGSLPNVSGYHDPVTARFVAASALDRRARGLPDTCFEREKARPRGQ